MTVAALILVSVVLGVMFLGVTMQSRKLRALHTPGGVGRIPAQIRTDGYHPEESVVYCRDCHSAFPCPTLRIYGIKK